MACMSKLRLNDWHIFVWIKNSDPEYTHLRDAINADGEANNVGRMTILRATYIGIPRHMHKYAQDVMSYVRQYGSPDLFIIFTCNPQWIEIKEELLPSLTPVDRHDIIAKVFKQKHFGLVLTKLLIRKCMHAVVTKNMIHGPCGIFNNSSMVSVPSETREI